MKTKIEAGSYEIEIEENDGVVTVKAIKEDEVVEEFALELEESSEEEMDSDEIKSFDNFEEEEDFGGEESGEEEMDSDDLDMDEIESDDDDDDDHMDESIKLKSFQSFIKKKK